MQYTMPAGSLRAGIAVSAAAIRSRFGLMRSDMQVRTRIPRSDSGISLALFPSTAGVAFGNAKRDCTNPVRTLRHRRRARCEHPRHGSRTEKVCAVSAQIGLCDAGSGCRSSAVREYQNGQ
jgi:hypothetical protein